MLIACSPFVNRRKNNTTMFFLMCLLSRPPLSTRIAEYCQPQASCSLRKIKLAGLGSRGVIIVKSGATCRPKEHLELREVT